jgi:hypothetical protein
MFRKAAETLARLHGVDVAAAGLADFGRPVGYFARQLSRWHRQWDLSAVGPNAARSEARDRLSTWRGRMEPPDTGGIGSIVARQSRRQCGLSALRERACQRGRSRRMIRATSS